MAEKTKRRNRKIGRNKKKGWRHIDITDVEQHLEDERLQQRTGGLVAEKSDEKLYFVDKDTTTKIQEKQEEDLEPSAKKRRKKIKPLRCFAMLESDPHIKPVRMAQNTKKKAMKTPTGPKTLKQRMAENQRQNAKRALSNRVREIRNPIRATYDLWGDKKNSEGLGEDEHYMRVTRKRRVNVPIHYNNKMSALAAVEVPHPGASYNPAYDDHQDLLKRANTVEVKKAAQERRLYNALDAKFPKAHEAPTEATWIEEMSAGLHKEDGEDSSSLQHKDDRISYNPAVQRENKKTERQQKKKMEVQLKLRAEVEKKKRKLRENEVFRINTIKKEIRKEEKCIEENKKKKQKLKEEECWQTKKLGKMKYQDPEVELKLSDELVGSLREMKPEGNLLLDRFKSLQKRNVIEPRLRAKRKNRYKKKVFEKKGHKDITL